MKEIDKTVSRITRLYHPEDLGTKTSELEKELYTALENENQKGFIEGARKYRNHYGSLMFALMNLLDAETRQKIVVEEIKVYKRFYAAEQEENLCKNCGGDGYVDVDGDCGELGWDKVGEKPCPVCFPKEETV